MVLARHRSSVDVWEVAEMLLVGTTMPTLPLILTINLALSLRLQMWIAMAIAWWPLTVRVSAVVLPRLMRLVSAVVLAQQTLMPMVFATMQTIV